MLTGLQKKSFMSKYPLNEELTWGEGEDVEWSKRIRRKTKLKFNEYSYVQFLKKKRMYILILMV